MGSYIKDNQDQNSKKEKLAAIAMVMCNGGLTESIKLEEEFLKEERFTKEEGNKTFKAEGTHC